MVTYVHNNYMLNVYVSWHAYAGGGGVWRHRGGGGGGVRLGGGGVRAPGGGGSGPGGGVRPRGGSHYSGDNANFYYSNNFSGVSATEVSPEGIL